MIQFEIVCITNETVWKRVKQSTKVHDSEILIELPNSLGQKWIGDPADGGEFM